MSGIQKGELFTTFLSNQCQEYNCDESIFLHSFIIFPYSFQSIELYFARWLNIVYMRTKPPTVCGEK